MTELNLLTIALDAYSFLMISGTTKNAILVGSLAVGLSPVVVGHTEELWACASHPTLPQFITAGFDGIIYLWDSMAHSLVWSKELNSVSERDERVSFAVDG